MGGAGADVLEVCVWCRWADISVFDVEQAMEDLLKPPPQNFILFHSFRTASLDDLREWRGGHGVWKAMRCGWGLIMLGCNVHASCSAAGH